MRGLILIDGGPASGKNTLGRLLVRMFKASGDRAVLLDLDTYVEKYNPSWIWENDDLKDKDQLAARVDIAQDIDNNLQRGCVTIVIGERFLTRDDVIRFIQRLKTASSVYLYHLNIPLAVREKRLRRRGPQSIIDLAQDQKDRDAVKDWPGCVYRNINSAEVDAKNLMALIKKGKGLLTFDRQPSDF